MPKPREWYFPEPIALGREIGWNLGPWEVQWNRGITLPEFPGKAKAPPSPQTRLREGQVQQQEEEIDEGAQAISF